MDSWPELIVSCELRTTRGVGVSLDKEMQAVDRVELAAHKCSGLVAVWSFWSQPFEYFHRERWLDDEFHMLSWILSLATVSDHFPTCVLVTDTPGARLLMDELDLPFAEVSTVLDRLDPSLRDWWVLGKLRTFADQHEPFLHFDSDVYLWEPLPSALTRCDIITQNPEPAPIDDRTYYKPTRIAQAFDEHCGVLPSFVTSYMRDGQSVAFCTGIFGGSALPVIHRFADEAEHLVSNPANGLAWRHLNDPRAHSVYVEQYLLAALITEEQRRRNRALTVGHLFTSQRDAFSESNAERAGFTHLIGEAKQSPVLKHLVAERVHALDPRRFDIVCRTQRRDPSLRRRFIADQPVTNETPASSAQMRHSSSRPSYPFESRYSSLNAYGYPPWSFGIGVSRLGGSP